MNAPASKSIRDDHDRRPAKTHDRTIDEILRDPPPEVLDGFGYRRGPTWDAFCRELAAAVEATRTIDEILRDPPPEVLDGFGYRRGPTWDAFCRELAAAVEATHERVRLRVLMPGAVRRCSEAAVAATRTREGASERPDLFELFRSRAV